MFGINTTTNAYVRWLAKYVGGLNSRELLMLTLLNMEFYSDIHDFDKNRMSDAMKLRRSYMEETHLEDEEFYEIPPSVLEVLIALAYRIENDILSESDGITAEDMFNMFLENMGIDFIFDWEWDDDKEVYIQLQACRFMDRLYNADGSDGGIFVLKHPDKNVDLRTKDIWMQAQHWLRETIM